MGGCRLVEAVSHFDDTGSNLTCDCSLCPPFAGTVSHANGLMGFKQGDNARLRIDQRLVLGGDQLEDSEISKNDQSQSHLRQEAGAVQFEAVTDRLRWILHIQPG